MFGHVKCLVHSPPDNMNTNKYRCKVQNIVHCHLSFIEEKFKHEGILSMLTEKIEIKMPKTNDKPQLSSSKS